MDSFIDEKKIVQLIENKKNVSPEEIRKILDKALLLKGLDLEDVAALINIEDVKSKELLFKTALEVKELIYGNKIGRASCRERV